MDTRLSTPVFDVVIDNGDDGYGRHRVQVINVDLVRFDRTAAKHGWPAAQNAPMLWNTFVVWSALRRLGLIDSALSWESFEERALQIQPVPRGELNGTADGVDPTPLEAELV